MQGLAFFSTFSSTLTVFDRRFARTREPVAAARLYLDRLVAELRGERGGVGAAVLAEDARVVAGAGLSAAELVRLATAALGAARGEAGTADAPPGDVFVHRIRVRGREHLFATLGGRARRVREVERDLARILGT